MLLLFPPYISKVIIECCWKNHEWGDSFKLLLPGECVMRIHKLYWGKEVLERGRGKKCWKCRIHLYNYVHRNLTFHIINNNKQMNVDKTKGYTSNIIILSKPSMINNLHSHSCVSIGIPI